MILDNLELIFSSKFQSLPNFVYFFLVNFSFFFGPPLYAMITDTYPNMMPDISMRSMLKNRADYSEELDIHRSGSAPPTVEGSLNAVGGLFDAKRSDGKGFVSEEELRTDPAYVNYYYSNVNLNPRLPPPLLSKEDWRSAQREKKMVEWRLKGVSGALMG